MNIHEAVQRGDFKTVEKLLKSDPTIVNEWDLNLKTPLLVIFDGNNDNADDDDTLILAQLSIIQLLIDYKADLNARTKDDKDSILHIAIKKKQLKAVELLLKNDINPNMANNNQQTPLHEAVKFKNQDYIELLLSNSKIDINFMGIDTPLDCAFFHDQMENALLLIKNGAKVSDIYYSILTSLSNDKDDLHQKLIYAKEIDPLNNYSLEKILDYIMFWNFKDHQRDYKKIKNLLRDNDIDVKKKLYEISPFHYAVEGLNEDAIKSFLESGFDVNTRDKNNSTALHILLVYPAPEEIDRKRIKKIAKLLIDQGADIRANNDFNVNPFKLAVVNDHSEVVNLMLAKLSDTDPTDLKCDLKSSLVWHYQYYQEFDELDEITVAIKLGYNEIADRLIRSHFKTNQNRRVAGIKKFSLFHSAPEEIFNKANSVVAFEFQRIYRQFQFFMAPYVFESFEMLCSLWNLNDDTINEAFICEVLPNYSANTIYYREYMAYLAVFHYAVKLRNNKLNGYFSSMKGLFKVNDDLAKMLLKINQELDKLEKMMITKDYSAFDLLSMSDKLLINFLNHKDNYKAVKNWRSILKRKTRFEKYKTIVLIHISSALEKRRLLSLTGDFLNVIFEKSCMKNTNFYSLPENIMETILENFSRRDLIKITGNDAVKF